MTATAKTLQTSLRKHIKQEKEAMDNISYINNLEYSNSQDSAKDQICNSDPGTIFPDINGDTWILTDQEYAQGNFVVRIKDGKFQNVKAITWMVARIEPQPTKG